MNAKNNARLVFGILCAVATLVLLATGNKAWAQAEVLSDELLISVPAGVAPAPVLLDTFIPEPALTAVESEATFFPGGPSGLVPPPVPLAGVLPFSKVVLLSEPNPDPAEPPIFFSGPNGPIQISDMIVSTVGNTAGAPPFITLVSDGNPDLAQLVPTLPPTTPFIAETGLLQDVTAMLDFPAFPGIGPVTVQVRSDVPEPTSVALAGMAAIGLIAWRIRARKRI